MTRTPVLCAAAISLSPALAQAAPWEQRLEGILPDLTTVAQEIELVDLDADGFVDIVLALSRGDQTGGDGDAQLSQALRNDQGAGFTPLVGVFDAPENAYTIKAGDLDSDGDPDLVVGVNFGGQSYALLQDAGVFTRVDLSPGLPTSIGDLELGDLDADGDLDILAADWGDQQPYGQLGDPGGPLRLWLGDGLGGFTDASATLPMGPEARSSWSFDLELVDLDNDFDLDVLVASRGPGNALAFLGAGDGTFTLHDLEALQVKGKDINTAFTPLDLDGDELLDLVTLQDGGEGCTVFDGQQACGRRGAVLLGDGLGALKEAPDFWPEAINPVGDDFDAAALDFNNDGRPDLVVTGPRLAASHHNAQLLLNGGLGLAPAPFSEVFPQVIELAQAFGVAVADFDGDRREDLAIAVRDDTRPSGILFGSDDPIEGVPEDTSPPRLGPFTLLPDPVAPGQTLVVHARVHDHKAPTRWHDFLHDPDLHTYNLVPDALTAHRRRLPELHYALGLPNGTLLDDLPDAGPDKTIVPGVWIGEALWRFRFPAPPPARSPDTLTWQLCAVDAAGNRACVGPFQTGVTGGDTCGDGVIDPWEECDDFNDPLCVMCQSTCGDGACAPPEDADNCPLDCSTCDNNGFCEPEEAPDCCDCGECAFCGDGLCDPSSESPFNCPADCTNFCGDCECQVPETPETCPSDCANSQCQACGDGVCDPSEEGVCLADCGAPDSGTDGEGDDLAICGCQGAPAGPLALVLLALPRRRARARRR